MSNQCLLIVIQDVYNMSLKVSWDEVDLENTTPPKYLGVTLDRMLSYQQHIQNIKIKVATHNILKKS